MASISLQRTLSNAESMFAIFMALLIPALSAGAALPTLTAAILF